MLKTEFKNQFEFDMYKIEQKIRMDKGYLTCSEREILKKMQEINYKPIFIKEKLSKLPIVTDINYLRQPCEEVTKEDNIKEIIQKLKDTLENYKGVGLTANQIGIKKKISYIKIPKFNKDKKIEFNEYILINTKIIEQDKPIQVKNEGCLSLPGIYVNTQRFVFITVEYYDEEMKLRTGLFQDLESIVVQHESDHQSGIFFTDRKWRSK